MSGPNDTASHPAESNLLVHWMTMIQSLEQFSGVATDGCVHEARKTKIKKQRQEKTRGERCKRQVHYGSLPAWATGVWVR